MVCFFPCLNKITTSTPCILPVVKALEGFPNFVITFISLASFSILWSSSPEPPIIPIFIIYTTSIYLIKTVKSYLSTLTFNGLFTALSLIIAEFPVGSSIIIFCFSWPHIILVIFFKRFFAFFLSSSFSSISFADSI